MGQDSKIAWTHHTFNPWWGCVEVSPGCANCYAKTFAKRTGHAVWGEHAPRRLFGEKHWYEPLRWNDAAAKAGTRARVFCASMADVFEDFAGHPQEAQLQESRTRLFDLILLTPLLDWLLLTKRPENMTRLAPAHWRERWPSNVWAGTTTEDQRRAEERIPHLLRAPARVRFLSVEPQLEAVDLDAWLTTIGSPQDALPPEQAISWVICGGESGHKAFHIPWARSLRDQCRASGVPFFMKQVGARAIIDGSPPGMVSDEARSAWVKVIHDSAGADPGEWPEDLRVQEFPS